MAVFRYKGSKVGTGSRALTDALAVEQKIRRTTIMALAGHLSRKMMEHYSRTRNDAKRQAISILDRIPSKPQIYEGSPVIPPGKYQLDSGGCHKLLI